jgi:hypothetical protein
MHRGVNILTHAAAAEVVGVLATRLFVQPTPRRQLLLRMITKIVFILHPTHVEVTANAANRNHILAVLFSTLICDPECPLWLFGTALVAGFLASETFLFQIPAAALTLVVVHYHYKRRPREQLGQPGSGSGSSLLSVIQGYVISALALLPRLFFMVLAIALYLGGRAYFDTLNIPEGLIRPAENPFYHFEGEHRIRNYLYTLSIHIAKSWGMDPMGFAHEYGFDCIPELEDWRDPRLALPCAIAVALLLSLVLAFRYPRTFLGPVAIHWAWLLTLFPVSGFVKVGTFVSDRIVVSSTVSVSLWVGLALHNWLTRWMYILPARPLQAVLVGWMLAVSYLKIHNRSLQWMDSISLMESALETCNHRFAKALMETSKIYSGLFPDLLDLQKSRNYLEKAREVDPDMCDLHYQFAIVSVQEAKYLEYEEELTRAVVCPFTMQGALAQWQRYWEVNMNNSFSPAEKERVQQRYDKSRQFIEDKVAEDQRREEAKKHSSGSPGVDSRP